MIGSGYANNVHASLHWEAVIRMPTAAATVAAVTAVAAAVASMRRIHNANVTEKAASFAHQGYQSWKKYSSENVPSNVTPVHSLLQSLVSNGDASNQWRADCRIATSLSRDGANACGQRAQCVCVVQQSLARREKRPATVSVLDHDINDCGQSHSAEHNLDKAYSNGKLDTLAGLLLLL
jgi:hypothetical protein